MAVETLELHLLGPPRVFLGDRAVALPTKKALALLAYLALAGPASRGKLADLLWSELDEDTARKNLRQEFHRLQNTPLALYLLLAPNEIRLGGSLQTDLQAFRIHVQKGDWAGAISAYRGPLLSGLELRGASGFEEWLEVTRAALAGEYQNALRHRAGQLEDQGDLRAAVGTYQTLLAAEPFEEHTYRELMRLHALLGEREAALELYRRCVTMLEREFALNPLPETTDLAERIRNTQTVAPVPAPRKAPKTPNLNPPLVGREREWERLEAALAEGRVAHLAGEAGVGKSRLLAEFAARKGGANVLQGQPGDLNVPYSTFTRGMRLLLRETGVNLQPWERTELSRLIPELAETEPPPIRSEYERLRLFDAFSEVFWRAARTVPLFIGEDVHWFDPASSELAFYTLAKFAGEGRRIPSFASYRPQELSPSVQAAIESAVRAGVAEIIELEPLSEVSVAQMISRMSGEPVTVFPRRIHKATGGNPFFVLETLKGLFESGELQVGERGVWATPYDEETLDYRELPIPASVRTAVLGRAERQGGAARRLLEVASLVGEGFRLEDLTGVTALGEWEVLEALEGAEKAGLIRPEGKSYGFAHDLIRRALEESLTPDRRRLIHRKLAETLEKAGAEPARVALHLEKGGQGTEASKWWAKAGEAALRVFANRNAFAHFSKALALLPGDAEGRFELLAKHERLAYDLGEREAEAADLEEMAALAQTPALRGRVALRQYAFLSITGRPAEARAMAERSLALFGEAGDEAGRAETLFHLAEASYYLEHFVQALQQIEPAIQAAKAQNPVLLMRSLNLKAFVNAGIGEIEAALGAYQEALEALRTHPNLALQARTLNNRATSLCNFGAYQAGLLDLDRALEIDRRAELRHHEAFCLDTRAKALRGLGRLEEAQTDLLAAIALGRRFKSDRLVAHCLATMVGLLNELRRPEAALGAAEEALQAAAATGSSTNRILTLAARAEAYLTLNQPHQALQDAEEAYNLLEAQGGLRESLPEGVRLAYIRALLANGRSAKARPLLERAKAEMLARAERISDPTLRQNYLGMRVNQELLSLEV